MRFSIPKFQWDTTPFLKLFDGCVNKLLLASKMNHLLRVTSAMRLFQSGVDKQLIIMSHTGHRSVDGVRSYKRISEEQKKKVSGILSSVST